LDAFGYLSEMLQSDPEKVRLLKEAAFEMSAGNFDQQE
jgi:hypothetical protein